MPETIRFGTDEIPGNEKRMRCPKCKKINHIERKRCWSCRYQFFNGKTDLP